MKKMLKMSYLKFFSIVFLCAVIVAGCSNNADESKGKKTTITYYERTGGDTKTEEAWKSIVDNYNQKQDKVVVKLKKAPNDLNALKTYLTTSLTGGTAPDIYANRTEWSFDQYNKGQAVDLKPYYNKPNPYNDNKIWKDTIVPSVFEQLVDPVTGKIPDAANSTVSVRMLYNKDIFNKYDLKPPTTFVDFMNLQQKLKKNGVTPVAAANKSNAGYTYGWALKLLQSSLLNFKGDDGLITKYDFNKDGILNLNEMCSAIDQGDIDMTKPRFTHASKLLKEWSQYWASGYNSMKKHDAYDMFLRGEAAMTFTLNFDLSYIAQSEVRDFEYGEFPFPKVTKETDKFASGIQYELGVKPDSPVSIASTTKGKKLEAAVDFLMYMASPEVAKQSADKLYKMPVLKDVDLPEKTKGFIIKGKQIPMNLFGMATFQKSTEEAQEMGQLYLTGKMSLEEFSQNMQKSLQDEASKFMKSNGWSKENNYGAKNKEN